MKKHLRWWVFTCLTLVVLALAGIFGFYTALAISDVTYLGFAIIVLYGAATARMCVKMFRSDHDFDFMFYLSDVMERMGLLGTVIGLIIAFSALYDVDLTDVQQAKELIIQVVIGVLTALYTTLVGLVGAMFLRTQVAIVEMIENKDKD